MSISINKKYSFEISINSPTILVRNHSQLNQLDYESSGHTGFASEQDILDLESDKVDKNNVITAGTKAKITYDSKGLVTAGADLIADDIPALPITKITNLSTTLSSIDSDISAIETTIAGIEDLLEAI